MGKKIAVLAVQGAFVEHERALSKLGCECVELRQGPDIRQSFDALVLPGGESTVQRKLLMESGMLAPIKSWIEEGVPVLATCAGLILLAEHLSNDERTCFKTLPVTVRRNAYGRQLGSFVTEAEVRHIPARCARISSARRTSKRSAQASKCFPRQTAISLPCAMASSWRSPFIPKSDTTRGYTRRS